MISTRGRYAVRAMVELAERNTGAFVPLSDIAGAQEISVKYLELILKAMVQGGLLEGQRGKGGGYRLSRPPEAVSVGEILELAEGELAPVACLALNAAPCPRRDNCRTLPMWRRFDDLTRGFFYGITLRDLMADAPRPFNPEQEA